MTITRVIDRQKIQLDLIKLISGERFLRFTDPASGLALEKKLDPQTLIVGQKEQLIGLFEAALERAAAMMA